MSEQSPRRRGPKKAPPETRFRAWNVTLPPDLSDKLFLLQRDGETKSELITRLLEGNPAVAALKLPPKT